MKFSKLILLIGAFLGAALTPVLGQPAYTVRQIEDLRPGSDGSYPSNLTVFGTSVLFDANTVSTGTELWKYDGTAITLAADVNKTSVDAGGGVFVGNSSTPNWLTVYGGNLYFSAFEPTHGAELWRYDGNSAVRVTDINVDANDTIKVTPNSAWPSNLTLFNGSLYFTANNNATRANYELWKYDGTTASLAANIHPDSGTNYSSFPTGTTLFNGALYFMADDGSNGYELWKYDGAKATLLTNINPGGASSSSFPNSFTVLNNQLYFQAFDQTHGYELWKTDGSTASVVDINAGSAGSFPQFLTAYNGALYFRATDGTHGYELWKYDGTTASLVTDLNPGGDSYPKNLKVFGNALYFSADDGVHGWELWKYDGTSVTLVSDLNPSGDSFPDGLTVFNNALYFSATTPETGYELWKYDGQTITLVADMNPGPGDSYPRYFTPLGTQLVFTATSDGASNWELWALAPAAPNQNPTVALTSPTEGSSFLTTDSIAFAANASDDGSVSKVEFFANGNLIGTAATAPYTVSAALTAGSYAITAKATDNLGASTLSAAVNITVLTPNQPPTVTLTSPANGSAFLATDSIAFVANATDDVSVSKVEFFANGNLIGTAATAPYTVSAALTEGSYAITAKATDNTGLSTVSSSVTVTAQATGNQSPVITLSSAQSGKVIPAPATIGLDAAATDADGTIVQVEFFNSGVSIGVDTANPYELTITNLAAGVYSFTAVATDNKGAKTSSAAIQISVAAQPEIMSINRSAGTYRIDVNGTTGIPHILEATADLSSWSAIATNTPISGMTSFEDSAIQAKRFYRVVVR